MKTIKQITPTANMSNLVGLYFIIWDSDNPKRMGYVRGKASDKYYIVQYFNWLDGEPNTCQLMDLEKMIMWNFFDSEEMLGYAMNDYDRHKINRFKLFDL